MLPCMGTLRRFFCDTRGSTAIEYGLIVGLIACVAIISLQRVGSGMNNKLQVISNALS